MFKNSNDVYYEYHLFNKLKILLKVLKEITCRSCIAGIAYYYEALVHDKALFRLTRNKFSYS